MVVYKVPSLGIYCVRRQFLVIIYSIVVQGVLDYRNLDYREFAIPGSTKNSIYSCNFLIIGISILGIVLPKLSGFQLLGNFFWT